MKHAFVGHHKRIDDETIFFVRGIVEIVRCALGACTRTVGSDVTSLILVAARRATVGVWLRELGRNHVFYTALIVAVHLASIIGTVNAVVARRRVAAHTSAELWIAHLLKTLQRRALERGARREHHTIGRVAVWIEARIGAHIDHFRRERHVAL